jgi:hypothetical protein
MRRPRSRSVSERGTPLTHAAVALSRVLGSAIHLHADRGRQRGPPARRGVLPQRFLAQFWSATFENWHSEWIQLVVQAVILLGVKHILFRADAEDVEQVQRDLSDIERDPGIPPRDRPTADVRLEVDVNSSAAGAPAAGN